MAKRHERSLARKSALQVLYSAELVGVNPAQIIEDDLLLPEIDKFSNYAQNIVRGVGEFSKEIDEQIFRASENWAIDRMPVVDRCILRIAVYEIFYVDKVPASVAINEAIDLAKEFGGEDDSGRFVNGILGKVAKMCAEDEFDGASDVAQSENSADEN